MQNNTRKIGVAITSYKRPEVLSTSLPYWQKYLPNNAELIIVKDVKGIPKAKNLSIKLLEEASVTDYFLVDDDVYPIHEDWWKPYYNSKEPHLMYIFTGFGNQTKGIREVYRDNNIVAYDHVRGCFLYYKKIVFDTVGGFDTDFGLGQYEHTNLTDRIFNSGLTSYRVMDVPGSNKLIYSMDEHQEVKSTFNERDRMALMIKNKRLKALKNNADYKAYK